MLGQGFILTASRSHKTTKGQNNNVLTLRDYDLFKPSRLAVLGLPHLAAQYHLEMLFGFLQMLHILLMNAAQ